MKILLKISAIVLLTATLAQAYTDEEKAQQMNEMRSVMQALQAKIKANPNMKKAQNMSDVMQCNKSK